MRRFIFLAATAVVLLGGCAVTPASTPPRSSIDELTRQVAATERGFARTMAERNRTAFAAFLADEAIFFTGPTPIRGKQAVTDAWKRFYEKPEAPFSWEPESVQVIDSGTLAISTGPVRDPSGKHFANFQSIWRQEAAGVWKIVFDRGERVCDCAKP